MSNIFQNKKLTLFGCGETTKAIAEIFPNSTFFDDSNSDKFNPNESEIEVVSPGIPPDNELVKKAKNLYSEYDLFSEDMPFSIWISGTNGKTTTTQMVAHLLKKRGAICGGNIGMPLAKMDKNAPIWVLETSSFTLHYSKIAKPDIYILLPITEDHISWHGNFQNYENAKLKPLQSMQEGEAIILPQKYIDTPTDGFKIGYENSQDLAKYFDIDISKIKFREPFLLDAILALGVTKILFDEVNYNLINSFVVDKHKVEEFKDKKNRIWIDDSKATNIDATIKAIEGLESRKIYLILGGDSKGQNLEPLFEFLKNRDIEIFAIGRDRDLIENFAKKYNIKYQNLEFLNLAIKEIDKIHDNNSIAILSPASASLDQFSGYRERGEKFKVFVNSLC